MILPRAEDRAKTFQRPLQPSLLAAAGQRGKIPKPLIWVCWNEASVSIKFRCRRMSWKEQGRGRQCWRKPTQRPSSASRRVVKMFKVYDRALSPVGKPSAFVWGGWSPEVLPAPPSHQCVVGTTVVPGQCSVRDSSAWEGGYLGWLRHGFRINLPSGCFPGLLLRSVLSERGKSWSDGTFHPPSSPPSPASSTGSRVPSLVIAPADLHPPVHCIPLQPLSSITII